MSTKVHLSSTETLATTAASRLAPRTTLLHLIPGVLLFAAVGLAGKFVEQPITRYGKAHYLVLPNVEYVLMGHPLWRGDLWRGDREHRRPAAHLPRWCGNV